MYVCAKDVYISLIYKYQKKNKTEKLVEEDLFDELLCGCLKITKNNI